MTTIYVKFIRNEDIYLINPLYDLALDGFVPSKICGRCGDTLYIPVEVTEDLSLVKPIGDIYRPFPKENPDFIIRGESEPMTLSSGNIEVQVMDVSKVPVRHKCNET